MEFRTEPTLSIKSQKSKKFTYDHLCRYCQLVLFKTRAKVANHFPDVKGATMFDAKDAKIHVGREWWQHTQQCRRQERFKWHICQGQRIVVHLCRNGISWTPKKNRTGHHQSAQISANLQHLCICLWRIGWKLSHNWKMDRINLEHLYNRKSMKKCTLTAPSSQKEPVAARLPMKGLVKAWCKEWHFQHWFCNLLELPVACHISRSRCYTEAAPKLQLESIKTCCALPAGRSERHCPGHHVANACSWKAANNRIPKSANSECLIFHDLSIVFCTGFNSTY